MRRWHVVFTAVLLAMAMATQAAAWELSMKGDWEWRYRYWTRTGNHDIFGEMDDTRVNLGINHLWCSLHGLPQIG